MAAPASTAKAFVSQVHAAAARTSQGSTPTIRGTDCARFWLQGLVVDVAADGARCAIDDGTGVVAVDLRSFRKSIPAGMATPLERGDLVMVIGPLLRRPSSALSPPLALSDPTDSEASGAHSILAHQVMVVTNEPQQDAIWFLEVIEYWRVARHGLE